MKFKSYFIIVLIIAILIVFSSLSYFKLIGNSIEEINDDELKLKFNILSNARTNFCAGPDILSKINTERLQGSCCSAMDFHRYVEQVRGLKKYSRINKIPLDPYDIPTSLVNELLNFQKNIKLTIEQQLVYDNAMKLSHEGGPCCCRCWRWYAFEGLAKYLITEYNFNTEQIAEVWDLEDGCGGSGHINHGEEIERETFEPKV